MHERVSPAAVPADRTTVRAVSRALALLRAFTPGRPRLTLAEAALAAALDKGTARRLLLTLMDQGLVRQDGSGRYALTLRMLELAASVETGGLREEARPVMVRLAAATGATVFLSVADGPPGALCLERVHGHDPVRVHWWGVGSHMPWNCGAGPRLLLAYMAQEAIAAALAEPRVLTPHSETDMPRLRSHLEVVRARGFEVTQDDVVVGLSAVAMPVRDAGGAVMAALSLGGLTALLVGPEGMPRWLDELGAAAAEISSHLR